MNILQDIYNGRYEPTRPNSPQYRALREKCYAYWDKVQEAMGDEFLDQFWNHEVEMEDEARFHDFREGFLLGASLILELL